MIQNLTHLNAVIDTCDFGHRFIKLPDHPMKRGQARCIYCLAIGFDAVALALDEAGRRSENLDDPAFMG